MIARPVLNGNAFANLISHRSPQQSRIFYTSLRHTDDFQIPDFRHLLLNAFAWALKK